jgi:4-amino-4-deoxy-L-arabinose transferase-like glycosyltransferase
LGAVRHGYDNAYQIYDAVRLLDGGQWLLIGQPSSVFLDNPPLMAYLQAAALMVWRSPWSPYLLVTALNTAAIWFVYDLGRELKGIAYGLIAALLFAVSPWVVHFSRFTWTQGLLPFFLAVACWGLWPALVTERANVRRYFLGLLALAGMLQSYVLAYAILAPVALLLLVFRRRLPQRALVATVLAVLLCLTPYGPGLSTRLESNLEKLARFAGGGSEAGPEFQLEALEHTVRLVTGYE